MRPLNRPMFRYGGPIKEGIMDGIKEPRQGYNRGKIVSKILNKIPGGQAIISGTKDIIPRTINRVKNFYKTPSSTSKDLVIYNAADAAKRNPAFLTNRYLFEKGIKPVAGGIYKTGKTIVPYTGVGSIAAGGGLGIYNMLKGDPNAPGGPVAPPGILNPRKEKIIDTSTGTNTDMSTKSAEELRKDRVQRYRDIMDIKGMNKNAAYNSLIAASQLINQEGDFKGSLKDGSLISKIIGATSKAFDKPSQTKDAIDTLILKGEIEKDIKASDPAAKLAAELTQKRINLAEKQLAGDSLEDTVNTIFARTGAFPSGSGLASVARTKGIDVKMVIKSEDINNFIKQNPGKDAVDFMEIQVGEAQKSGTPIEPGAYVVKDRIIVIDSEGNVSPYL